MKKTLTILCISLVVNLNAQQPTWTQQKFALAAYAASPLNFTDFDHIPATSNISPAYDLDISNYENIYNCYFNLLLTPSSAILRDWTPNETASPSTDIWVYDDNGNLIKYYKPGNLSNAIKQRNYILHIAQKISSAQLNRTPFQVMLSDISIAGGYPSTSPLGGTYSRSIPTSIDPNNIDWFPQTKLNNPYNSYIYGFYLCDEPRLTSYSTTSQLRQDIDYENLHNFSDLLYNKYFLLSGSNATKPLPNYTNLPSFWGNSNPYTDNATYSYKSYLDKYDQAVLASPSPIISFDHYPFWEMKLDNSLKFDNRYFVTLNYLKSRYSQKNIWATVHTYSLDVEPDWDFRIPNNNEKELQFMAFCPIAYGVKGLNYWATDGKYFGHTGRTGVIDDPIKKTSITKINKYVQDIVGPIIMNNKNIATLHKNDLSKINLATSNIPKLNNFIGFQSNEKLENYNGIISDVSADDILVGIFSNSVLPANNTYVNVGDYYIWVVNKDTYNNNGISNLHIKLNGDYRNNAWIYPSMDEYYSNQTNSNSAPFNGADISYQSFQGLCNLGQTTLTISHLNPGEGRMIKINASMRIGSPQILANIGGEFISGGFGMAFTPGNGSTINDTYMPCTGYRVYSNLNASSATSSYWSVINHSSVFNLPSINPTNFYFFGNNQTATIRFTASNSCGTTSKNFNFISHNCTAPGNPCNHYRLANSTVLSKTVVATTNAPGITAPCYNAKAVKENPLSTEFVGSVKVLNKEGDVVKEFGEVNLFTTNLDFTDLDEGTYYIEITGNEGYKEMQSFNFKVMSTEKNLAEDIATGNISINTTNAEMRLYVLKQQLFNALQTNTDLLNSSSILQDFVASDNSRSFNFMYRIDRLFAEGNTTDAKELMSSWVPQNTVDNNNMQYYNYFVKFLKNEEFEDEEMYNLFNLANKCPLTDGEIVYAARSLYNYLTDGNLGFDNACEGVSRSSVIIKPAIITKHLPSQTKVYPNPTKGSLHVDFNLAEKGQNSLTLLDMYGKIVLQEVVTKGVNTITPKQKLAAGVYTLHIVNLKTGRQQNERIIVE